MWKNVTQFVGRTTEIHKYRLKQTQLIKCHFWRVLCGDKHEPKSGLLFGYCHSTSTNVTSKPYPEGTPDLREITFNKELSSGRVKVECAFGILKNRWRILLKWFDCGINFAICTAVACAVLHICIRNGDEWEEDEGNNDSSPGDHAPNVICDGEDIREILKDFL